MKSDWLYCHPGGRNDDHAQGESKWLSVISYQLSVISYRFSVISGEVATAPSNLRIVRQQSCQQFYIVALRNEAVLHKEDNSDYANKLASLV